MEDAAERVRAIVSGASELQAQQRSCSNAWNLYKRTRPAASPESAARARALDAPGPHPLLAAACTAYTQEDPQAQVICVMNVEGPACAEIPNIQACIAMTDMPNLPKTGTSLPDMPIPCCRGRLPT